MRAQRILIYGVTGSGKTTLARDLGGTLDVRSVSVDDEIGWLPGWVNRPVVQQRNLVEQIVAQDAWVMDTAYGAWLDVVLPRVEMIVALDYPRAVSLGRLVRRSLRRALGKRRICNDNTESFRRLFSRESILIWHFRSFASKRAQIRSWAQDPPVDRVLVLRSPRQTRAFLAWARQRHRPKIAEAKPPKATDSGVT
ncbi:adenylate kinase [Pseudactinotalea sp. Z1739]|uniref:adenylate kinase n=1 Tax=Pseudactinotalea sp. Z1739 TaxID=3413028 RepID=UPI003C79D3FA